MPTADDPRISVRLPRDLFDRLPAGRQRSVFVRGALEAALGETHVGSTAVSGRNPVSPRAPTGSEDLVTTASGEPVRVAVVQDGPVVEYEPVPPTAEQLQNKHGLTLAHARQALADGSWRHL